MDTEKSWMKFLKSGKVVDYLQFVDSVKEKDLRDGSRDSVYGRRFSDKGKERGGE